MNKKNVAKEPKEKVTTKTNTNTKQLGKINKKRVALVGIAGIAIIVLIVVLCIAIPKSLKKEEDAKPYDRGTELPVTEYSKIIDHKDDIEYVLTEKHKEGQYITAPCNIDDAYNVVKNLRAKKELDEGTETDGTYTYYIFTMKDGNVYYIHFEGEYLNVDGKNYEVYFQTEE